MRFIIFVLIAGLILGGVHVVAQTSFTTPEPPKPHLNLKEDLSGNLVFWDQDRGFQTIKDHAEYFNEINPFWYTLDQNGSITTYKRADGNSYEDPKIIDFLRYNHIRIVPTIANTYGNDEWPTAAIEHMLHDPALRAAHIKALVDLVVSHNYDGLGLDYENLPAEERTNFSLFVSSLATELHRAHKTLEVDVYAKTEEPGGWYGPQGQDWALIGQQADRVVIMVYNWHWSTSEAGVIAPADWTSDVLRFASRTIPRKKITYSMHLFGYDWIEKHGDDKAWQDFVNLAKSNNASILRDTESQEVYFSYNNGGITHTAWFVDARTTAAHLRLAKSLHVPNINFWRLGGEDPATWEILRRTFSPPGQGK